MSNDDRIPVVIRLGDKHWHNGPGWYYWEEDYPDEGSVGAFPTVQEAMAHARLCGEPIEFVGPYTKSSHLGGVAR